MFYFTKRFYIETKEIHEKPVRIADLLVESPAEYLPIASLERYSFTNL
jgi:hypothetical protein